MESYIIDKLLGRGAWGVVHLVTHKESSQQLALKRIDFEQQSEAERKATLLEVRLLARLQHPNIVGFLDHFHEGNELCIVMELAPDDLDKELRRAKKADVRISEARILDLLAQIAAALHFAHGCRVVHRDIKPANVLLAADGSARLADFGIACTLSAGALQLGRELKKKVDPEGRSTLEHEDECADVVTTLQGTPFYMAPELFKEALHVDGAMFSPASDVWALGVMLYELMMFRRPYSGENVNSLVYRLLSDLGQNAMADVAKRAREGGASATGGDAASGGGAATAEVSGYSAELCACVESMLQKRPRQRATLPAILGSKVLRTHERGGIPQPPLVDLLEAKSKVLGGLVPDCYAFGRGAPAPRVCEDLMGIVVAHLACGAAHCAIVTDAGELYTWGENGCGQLGHGDKRHLKRRRLVVFAHGCGAGTSITGVACGRSHTLALTTGGRLFACGSDKHGQLGLGPPESAAAAAHDAKAAGIADISDAADAKALEAAPGIAGGALRLHDAMGCVLTPAELPPLCTAAARPSAAEQPSHTWATVACGEAHSAGLTTNGWVYAWGCGAWQCPTQCIGSLHAPRSALAPSMPRAVHYSSPCTLHSAHRLSPRLPSPCTVPGQVRGGRAAWRTP